MRYEKSSALNVLFRPISISERFEFDCPKVRQSVSFFFLFKFLHVNIGTMTKGGQHKRRTRHTQDRQIVDTQTLDKLDQVMKLKFE